jgi:mitogen-activated protein kinase kinase kinase
LHVVDHLELTPHFQKVYLASNLDTGTWMAVKEILYKEQKEVERLRQSEQILTILHHPNVTMYYGVQIHRDRVFVLSGFIC